MGIRPGPVHVNIPFREPLVPSGSERPRSTGPTAEASTTVFGGDDELEDAFVDLIAARRGLIYGGWSRRPAPSLVELGRRLGWPLVAEPHSNLRVPGTLAAGSALLADGGFVRAHRPEIVLQVGAAPTSRAALAFVADAERLVIIDPDDLVADPNRRAERRLVTDAELLVWSSLERIVPRQDDGWLASWSAADAAARRTLDEVLDGWDEPFEGRIARDLAEAAPPGAVLLAGSSMPIRDLDAFMRPRQELTILANRGASGIDGFVSTALGASVVGRPTFALLGDLTLLHDAGSLLWSARRGHHVVLVVVNNGGGTIFRFLAQRELPELEGLFVTPHGLDLGALASAAGAGHTRVQRARELVPAIEGAAASSGVHVVEVVVDAELDVHRHAEVHEAVAESLRRTT